MHDTTMRYVLPMRIEWVPFDRERYNPTHSQLCVKVRGKERCSTLPTDPYLYRPRCWHLRKA